MLSVTPEDALIDVPRRIAVTGLSPGKEVVLHTRTVRGPGVVWRSAATLRRRRRFGGQQIDRRRQLRHGRRSQQIADVDDRGAPSSEMLRDHRVEAEDRRVHRDRVHRLEVRRHRGDGAAHGDTGYRDRRGLRLQPTHQRADL